MYVECIFHSKLSYSRARSAIPCFIEHSVQLFYIARYLENKWNESGFRPPLCTYRLNWARRTSWGWWDDTVLQTQDSKFEPWWSEAEHATSRSRRLPTILSFTRGWGRNIFCFFQTAETGNRTPDSSVKGSGANHYPRAPARQIPWMSLMALCSQLPEWRPLYDYWPPWRIRHTSLSKMRDSQLVYIIHLATETGNCAREMNKRSILRDLLWHIYKYETSNEVWISDTPPRQLHKQNNWL